MISVLINWRVIPERDLSFIEFWSSKLKLNDAQGLIGEFLRKAEKNSFYGKITWEMEPSEQEGDRSFWKAGSYVSFVNVGIWDTLEQFNSAVGNFTNADPKAMIDFEAAPLRRAVLTPTAWRIGSSGIPTSSLQGVSP